MHVKKMHKIRNLRKECNRDHGVPRSGCNLGGVPDSLNLIDNTPTCGSARHKSQRHRVNGLGYLISEIANI